MAVCYLLAATAAAAAATPPVLTYSPVAVPSSAQLKPTCATRGLGAVVRGIFYFAPGPGDAPEIVSYDPKNSTWGSIDVAGAGSGVMRSIAGATMAGVAAVQPGIHDFLVFAGGEGSNVVTQFDLTSRVWSLQKSRLSHVTQNLCSSGCLGYAIFATGDFKKAADAVDASFKPSDRQIQRYNLTSGQMEENNMEKTRAGAVCACYEGVSTPTGSPVPGGSRVFFAGGQDDAGATDSVEMWLPAPNIKRRGEPEFSMSFSGRDRGGLVCGGHLVLAGGRGIKKVEAEHSKRRRRLSSQRRRPPAPKPGKAELQSYVDVWLANETGPVTSDAHGSPGVKPKAVYHLSAAVAIPQVVCLADRYIVILGGHPAKGGCVSTAMHVLDLQQPPATGSTLPLLPYTLNSSASTFTALSFGDTAMVYDGATAAQLKVTA